MSPYNAYSSSLSSSRLSSYTPTPRSYTGSDSYSSLSSTYNYRYKPPAYSSTLSLKYRSPSSYSLNHSYTPSTLPRNASSSSFAARVPKFNSVSSYTNAILNASDSNWKSSIANDWLGRSPSLSRRNSSSSLVSSSHASERNSRLSLPAYTSSVEKTPAYKVNSWSCDKSDDVEDRRGVRVGLNNLGNTVGGRQTKDWTNGSFYTRYLCKKLDEGYCILLLNPRYGSERLINVLYSLGFAASYGNTVQFEISTAYHPQPRILSSELGALVQYVGNNANINVHTLDVARDDVDVLIVETAIEESEHHTTDVIVGEDIDLLVILIEHTNHIKKCSLKKLEKGMLKLKYTLPKVLINIRILNKPVQLSNIPPTRAAAHQRISRVFYQVQTWLGNPLKPQEGGCILRNEFLKPIMTILPPAPDELLKTLWIDLDEDCTFDPEILQDLETNILDDENNENELEIFE
ncbi:uncharacterized protein TNCV_13101 [Trichonephila clavipes]|nr:uncharacterized protein TNCV_13101 [Trichonephila clavipes]